ncbi:MAG: protein kinase domain-containing protein [Candidatus Binataceae bacterium]
MKPGESLSVGQMLDGRYRIHKVLGQGGMGRVYLANDTRLANRPVACKEMIIGDGLQEQKAIDDFNREARVLASLSHPSIPQIIDYFAQLGRHYLVMEFVAGGDLQSHLDKLGSGARMPEAKVLKLARQILDVLMFLHGQSPPIVYRDLKPGNIMIDQHGRAMLIDFGIARFLPSGGGGTKIGSIGYAPPEQYMGKMEPRSDLFSLAATMHHLLTGRDPQVEPPFSFPPVRQLAPQVSVATERVVMRALEKDLLKRPQSARAMRDELPPPGPEENDAPVLAGGANAAPGAMATIVLNRPVGLSSADPRPALSASPAPSQAQPPSTPAARPSSGASVPSVKGRGPAPSSPASSTAPTRELVSKAAASSASGKMKSGPAPSAPPRSVESPAAVSAIERFATAIGSAAKVAGAIGMSSAKAAGAIGAAVRQSSRGAGLDATAKTGPLSNQGAAALPPRPSAQRPLSGGPAIGSRSSSRSMSGNVNPLRGDTNVPPNNGYGETAAPIAGAKLIAVDGVQFGVSGGRVTIGRRTVPAEPVDIDLAILKRGNDLVSRRHAEIINQAGEYYIRDLGSSNGTYIGGRGRLGRDQLYKLRDRDEIILGGTKLQFRRG